MKQENTDYKIDDLTKKPPEEIVEPIPEEQLNLEAKMRAKKRPLLEKIIKLLKRDDEPYREIVINVEPFEKRVALLADGVMQKFEIERPGDESMVGAIFKGKIQNLEPGLKAAFVDIGQPKNAFLHYWDIFPSTTDNTTYEIVRENRSKEQKKNAQKFSAKDIPEKFPIGTEIIVQITKTQIGTKGPRITTNIAIPGRYLVLMPYAGQCGISRKIEDRKERDRILADILKKTGLSAEITGRKPSQLSGGEKARVAIARALSVSPSLLIADEPTASLDASLRASVLNTFAGLDAAMIIISHDEAVLSAICGRIYRLKDGKLICSEEAKPNPCQGRAASPDVSSV